MGAVESERDRYKAWMPPGHYYSPVPSLDEIRAREAQIFGPPPATLPGVDLNEEEQWALLDTLAPYIREQPFGTRRRAGQRYCFDNLYYSHYDAVFLYAMIRHLRPRRIVEIGSGHSSCVILDTNDLHFAGAIACTFVEPHPEALLALIRETDRERVEIVARPLQDVDAARFEALEANDVLIVDSTHVSKTGSDVNRLLFNVLRDSTPGSACTSTTSSFPSSTRARGCSRGAPGTRRTCCGRSCNTTRRSASSSSTPSSTPRTGSGSSPRRRSAPRRAIREEASGCVRCRSGGHPAGEARGRGAPGSRGRGALARVTAAARRWYHPDGGQPTDERSEMDLNYSPEETAFRDEVRAWLAGNVPADLSRKVLDYAELTRDDLLRWHRILAAKGWVAPAWPVEWGGTGWTVVERYIFEEECGYAGTPPLVAFGLRMCAPVLFRFGTDAQKKRFLPRIYKGEDFWCQGYSEPGAGSDLASLKTRAVRQGGHYVVTGQKTWTTLAHYADWIFCLVRTDATRTSARRASRSSSST